MRTDVFRTAVLGATAAAIATLAKGKTEGLVQPLAERAFPPKPDERTAIGADAAGHPENMPPSELADQLKHAATGGQLTDEQRMKVSVPLHWTMGLGFGIGYALVAARFPVVRVGGGSGAGAALFTATHGIGLPAARVQHPPWQMPTAWWGWEAGSHLVYGVVLDTSLRLLDRVVSPA